MEPNQIEIDAITSFWKNHRDILSQIPSLELKSYRKDGATETDWRIGGKIDGRKMTITPFLDGSMFVISLDYFRHNRSEDVVVELLKIFVRDGKMGSEFFKLLKKK